MCDNIENSFINEMKKRTEHDENYNVYKVKIM